MPCEDQEAVLKKDPSSTEFYSGPTGCQVQFVLAGCLVALIFKKSSKYLRRRKWLSCSA